MGAGKTARALIMGSAPCEDWGFLKDYLTRPALIIGADGGAKALRDAGLRADVLIGDWDSGGAPEAGAECISLPPEKDLTDLQAAADLALNRGCGELILCGCTGGPRLDHTASNLTLLTYIADRGGKAVIADPDNEVRLLQPGTLVLDRARDFRYLSLIPLDTKVTGVTLKGVKYPLEDALLTRGDTFSVSNEPVSDRAVLSIGTGLALLIRSGRECARCVLPHKASNV